MGLFRVHGNSVAMTDRIISPIEVSWDTRYIVLEHLRRLIFDTDERSLFRYCSNSTLHGISIGIYVFRHFDKYFFYLPFTFHCNDCIDNSPLQRRYVLLRDLTRPEVWAYLEASKILSQ